MISRIRPVGSASMPSEAGLTRSVSRFSSGFSGIFSSHAGLPHHGARRFETQARPLFGSHVFQPAPEDFYGKSDLVADLVEREQEWDKRDDALARHQPLVVADLVGRQLRCIVEVDVNDA